MIARLSIVSTELQAAFILHRRSFRNTSLLLEALTWEHGRIGLVARGASRAKTPWRALLQPFTPVLLAWRGRNDLVTLTMAEANGQPYRLPASRLLSGFYLNELLLRLLIRHDPCCSLFDAYQKTLYDLVYSDKEEPVLRRFEKTLLAETGYGLQLTEDVISGEPLQPDRYYCYEPQQGPRLASSTETTRAISGRALQALREDQLDEPQVLQEVKYLMRSVLDAHMDKPLRSREIMAGIQRRRRATQPRVLSDESN